MRAALVDEAGLAGHRAALARLERTRDYPLDGSRRFRIDHGADYGRFFRALGEPRFVVVEGGPAGLAGVAAAVRRPDGPWYVCDLKTDPRLGAAGPTVLRRLLRALHRATDGLAGGAYFVAMDGPADEGVARLFRGRGSGLAFRPVAGHHVYLAPVAGARPVDGPPVEVRTATGKEIVLVPDETPLRLAHLDGLPTAGAIAEAGRRGATTLCFTVDRADGDAAGRLAAAGYSTGAGATTYYRGDRWPGLPILSREI